MTLKGIILSEVSQTKTNILVLTEIRNIKMKQKVNITKQKQMQRTNQCLAVGGRGGEGQDKGRGLKYTN